MKAVEVHRQGIAKGADVWPQVSCRPLAFSMTMVEPFTLNTSPVFAELMPLSLDERRQAYGNNEWRDRVRHGWQTGQGLVPRWDSFEIMESQANPHLIGRRIADIAAETATDPFDTLLDLALTESDLALRVKAMLANDDPDGVAILLKTDGCTLGLSDAGAHIGQLCDAVLPTDLLGTWVRDKQVLTLEEAVNKLTKVQADLFRFEGRGVLAPGAFADVVVFDPDTVAPGPIRRVRDFPADGERLTADQPLGMHHLFVNGVEVVREGTLVDPSLAIRPGTVVRPGQR